MIGRKNRKQKDKDDGMVYCGWWFGCGPWPKPPSIRIRGHSGEGDGRGSDED